MSDELLTPAEMAEADRLTIAAGPADGIGLMRRAGEAVAAEVSSAIRQRSTSTCCAVQATMAVMAMSSLAS